MVDDVILAKLSHLERCLGRIRKVYAGDPRRLDDETGEDPACPQLGDWR